MKQDRIKLALIAVTAAAIAVLVHWPCVRNGFTHWDDRLYLERVLTHRPLTWETVRWAFTSTWIYYQPLSWLSHALDCRLWGLRPAGHHATSVVLHAMNTALVAVLLWTLLEQVAALTVGERLAATAGIALVFGVHPLQVESVAWIAERNNLLCSGFALGSLCAYIRAASGSAGTPTGVATPSRASPPRAWWWVMTLLFVAALLSKPMAVTLPLVMLALDYYPLGRWEKHGWGRLVKEKAVLWCLSGICSAITIGAVVVYKEGLRGIEEIGGPARLALAARSSLFYLWKLLWPAWLSPYYPLQGRITLGDIEFVLTGMAFIVITVLCVWRRSSAPGLWSAWLAYLALILPVSGLIATGAQAVADRYVYLGMLPPLLVAAGAAVWLWRRMRVVGRVALAVLLAGELGFFAFAARAQVAVWHDDETLWGSVLSYYPGSGFAQYQYAMALAREGRYAEALPAAREASRLMPGLAEAHATMGLIDLKGGRLADAEGELKRALQLDPKLWVASYNLACVYGKTGRFQEAFNTLEQVLSVRPRFSRTASRDPDLVELRDHPFYAERVRGLIGRAAAKGARRFDFQNGEAYTAGGGAS